MDNIEKIKNYKPISTKKHLKILVILYMFSHFTSWGGLDTEFKTYENIFMQTCIQNYKNTYQNYDEKKQICECVKDKFKNELKDEYDEIIFDEKISIEAKTIISLFNQEEHLYKQEYKLKTFYNKFIKFCASNSRLFYSQ